MKFSGKVGNGPVNKKFKFWWRFRSTYRDCLPEILTVVSTDCAARRCSVEPGHAQARVDTATITSLRHRPTSDSHDRSAQAEVCTVPELLVVITFLTV